MHTLTIVKNIVDPKSWITVETNDIGEALDSHFDKAPEHGRLYCGQVSKANEVTPRCEEDVLTLEKMTGPFWYIVFPGGVEELVYVAYALIAVVAIVAITQRPKIPNTANRNYQQSSPNNALSGRTNTPRINNRIPDIFGTVRSTPDLIAVPYSIFKNHIEYEYCYMCIGRGKYDIPASGVRDGQTVVSKIDGETVEIYGPNSSPNDGGSPQLAIGPTIDRLVISAVRSKSVNGQTLLAVNESDDTVNYNNLVSFAYPNQIVVIPGNPTTFPPSLSPGDFISVITSDVLSAIADHDADTVIFGTYNVKFHTDGSIEFTSGLPAGSLFPYIEISGTTTGGLNFDGKYLIIGVSGNSIILSNPANSNIGWSSLLATSAAVNITFVDTSLIILNFTGIYQVATVTGKVITVVNPDATRTSNNWNWLNGPGLDYNGGDYSWGFDGATVTIGSVSGPENWIGPFVLDVTTMTEVIANFVALNGMYRDNGVTQQAINVDIQVGCTPCDSAGTATGPEQFFGCTVVGSDATQSTRAITLFADVTTPGRYMVRARRLTAKDLSFTGTVVDEVKWRDVYASSPVGAINFGDVTTVHAVTQATAEALAVSERQLNMLVTRMLPTHVSGSTFNPTLVATNSADDIISFICLDPKLGNRQLTEVDFDQIYATVDDVKGYFGVDVAGEFCYTFDNDNMSFEEMLKAVAEAIFCSAQRRGRVIEITFEKATDDSVLLFNHRNKVPGSETRTTTFGARNNNDGVEYDYVSDVDDAIITFYVPEDRTAVNPLKIESVGVRNIQQAHLHSYREFNKLKYQTRAVEFKATQEAEIISLNSKVLIADNTRGDTQDGEIIAQNGLIVTLSQPAVIAASADYAIALQLDSGIVEIIGITAIDPYNMLLDDSPSSDLVIDDNAAIKTLYQIVKSTDVDTRSFLMTEKTPQSNFIFDIVAVNYDDRYYQNDQDMADFEDILLLLHLDGPDGSTTFIDSILHPNVTSLGGSNAGSCVIKAAGAKFGQALTLNGGGNHIVVANDGRYAALSTSEMTVEFWYTATALGSNAIIIAIQNFDSRFQFQFDLTNSGSQMRASGADGSGTTVYSFTDPDILVVGVRNFWQLTRKITGGISTYTLRKDGVIVGQSTSSTALAASASSIYIGAASNSTLPAVGVIDDLRISKKLQSPVVPTAPFPSPPGSDWQIAGFWSGDPTNFGSTYQEAAELWRLQGIAIGGWPDTSLTYTLIDATHVLATLRAADGISSLGSGMIFKITA